jgi:ribosomal protein S13
MRLILTTFDRNKKITAIKAVRKITGLGLKEAKECIDTVQTGVPSILENMSADDITELRNAGVMVTAEYPDYRLPLDKMQIMKDLVMNLMNEGQFKSAQYIIDAMEVLDE